MPPIITGSIAIVIGISLAELSALDNASGAAIDKAGIAWLVAAITLVSTVAFSVYLQGKGLLGMLPILFGAIVGYVAAVRCSGW